MKTKLSLIALLGCTLLAGCSAHKSETETEQPETLTLPVVQLTPQATTLTRDYVSRLEATQNVEIRARVSGYLEKIYVDEGQTVHKGQLLFKLNEAEYQAEFDRASANLKSAIANARTSEVEMGRVQLLVDKKIVSPSELELAKAKHEAAKAAIDEVKSTRATAALRLAHAGIRAPFDGTINRIPFKIGSLIEEGALLTTVSDVREIYAYFDVSEKEYLNYIRKNPKSDGRNGQEVEMLLADETPYPYRGRIETMESIFEEGAGTIAFRARFPNPKKLLRHGSSGKIRLANAMSDAILVPQKAVFEVQDKNYVFVVDASNKVKTRSFEPQGRVDSSYIVKSGLKAGDRVVYEGIQNVRDGMQIIPTTPAREAEPTPAIVAQH